MICRHYGPERIPTRQIVIQDVPAEYIDAVIKDAKWFLDNDAITIGGKPVPLQMMQNSEDQLNVVLQCLPELALHLAREVNNHLKDETVGGSNNGDPAH